MATQADLYADIDLANAPTDFAYCRRCGALVADTGIHTTWHSAAFTTATVTWPTDAKHGHISQ
jgi:hypothetical protein